MLGRPSVVTGCCICRVMLVQARQGLERVWLRSPALLLFVYFRIRSTTESIEIGSCFRKTKTIDLVWCREVKCRGGVSIHTKDRAQEPRQFVRADLHSTT
jgi:hypothetical protein